MGAIVKRRRCAVHTEVSRLKRINQLLVELDELIAEFEVKNNIRPCKRCGRMAFRHYHTCTTKL